ncbi:DUF2460 domain-containing protein [Bergeriella denitrificans]|uniref:Phage associated protein n=1 Tax=Bergeriella denitrificans TaxID=494 RepID=A0A378ULJ1_BERDE|nr:DUF2460 domain-containing protein [Bergeriella denitrificans]STZ77342.1 phage associated protein [Bergeriella denitrificans]
MGNAVFPTLPGLKWGVTKTPVWSTKVQKSVSGREKRTAYYSYPQWRFSLSFEVLRNRGTIRELETLAGFFNARRGSFESFLYEDPTDNQVTDQLIGNVVAGTTRYQLIRAFGGFVEPVLAVKGNPVIKINGVVKTKGRDYSITDTGQVVFHTPLTPGQRITWSGGFYFRVRFDSDTADFENFIGHLWSAKKITLVSVKS